MTPRPEGDEGDALDPSFASAGGFAYGGLYPGALCSNGVPGERALSFDRGDEG